MRTITKTTECTKVSKGAAGSACVLVACLLVRGMRDVRIISELELDGVGNLVIRSAAVAMCAATWSSQRCFRSFTDRYRSVFLEGASRNSYLYERQSPVIKLPH
jgi:hypothetical protein